MKTTRRWVILLRSALMVRGYMATKEAQWIDTTTDTARLSLSRIWIG